MNLKVKGKANKQRNKFVGPFSKPEK